MKTRAIAFSGACSLNWCDSGNDTENRAGVEVLLEAHGTLAGEENMGVGVCAFCALKLARLLKKRVRQANERLSRGLRYKYGASGLAWRKKKVAPVASKGGA